MATSVEHPVAIENQAEARPDRRTVLKSAAGVTVLIAGGGAWRAYDQGVFATGEGPAFSPWRAWPPDVTRDGPLALVGAAILAANPHNTQAWRFEIADDRIDLLSDSERSGGALDPFLREQTIGLGCALENLVLAAEASGYEPGIAPFPDDARPDLVARIALSPGEARSSDLFQAIPHRHTNRGPYRKDRPIGADLLESMTGLVTDPESVSLRWFVTAAERAQIAEAVIAANKAIDEDREQADETRAWFRTSWDDIQSRRDGLTIDTGGVSSLTRVLGKIIPGRFVPLSIPEEPIRTTPAFGLIVAKDATARTQQLDGGRFWQRMQLFAASHGLSMQPVDSPLVRADRETSLGLSPVFGTAMATIAGDEWQPLLPFRIGYAQRKAELSPRRPVSAVIVEK
jgi:nitroreductase